MSKGRFLLLGLLAAGMMGAGFAYPEPAVAGECPESGACFPAAEWVCLGEEGNWLHNYCLPVGMVEGEPVCEWEG